MNILNFVLKLLALGFIVLSFAMAVSCCWLIHQQNKVQKAFWDIHFSDIKAHNERLAKEAQERARKVKITEDEGDDDNA